MTSDITLYWPLRYGSGPCWRALICLEEKGLSGYNSKLLSFEKREHKSDEYLKINPRGQVPTLKHGNVVVSESLAICLYLESTFKGQGTTLLPDDPVQQALVLQRAVESQNIRENCTFGLVYYYYRTKPEDRKKTEEDERKADFYEELKIWEGYLAKLGDGSYITGNDFTLADACVFPFVCYLVRMGFKLRGRYPHLANYYDLMKDRPSVQAGWPPKWKETPNLEMLKTV